mmetsp:Transcript_45711/g.105462  ORF Transcript_45711/g.105462 Transcript_45711/m.105462 type:complete len:288 (-) Transcript_45711:109-972(-)
MRRHAVVLYLKLQHDDRTHRTGSEHGRCYAPRLLDRLLDRLLVRANRSHHCIGRLPGCRLDRALSALCFRNRRRRRRCHRLRLLCRLRLCTALALVAASASALRRRSTLRWAAAACSSAAATSARSSVSSPNSACAESTCRSTSDWSIFSPHSGHSASTDLALADYCLAVSVSSDKTFTSAGCICCPGRPRTGSLCPPRRASSSSFSAYPALRITSSSFLALEKAAGLHCLGFKRSVPSPMMTRRYKMLPTLRMAPSSVTLSGSTLTPVRNRRSLMRVPLLPIKYST